MREINCNASNCTYNKGSICYSYSVSIGGINSISEGETSCDSFSHEALNRGLTSSAISDNICNYLNCEVENCIHNSNTHCNLESINISGLNSQTSTRTQCSSFELK